LATASKSQNEFETQKRNASQKEREIQHQTTDRRGESGVDHEGVYPNPTNLRHTLHQEKDKHPYMLHM